MCFKRHPFFTSAEVLLSGEIDLKVSLKGFPVPVTSALSVASPRATDQYEHFVFSGRKNQPYLRLISVCHLYCPMLTVSHCLEATCWFVCRYIKSGWMSWNSVHVFLAALFFSIKVSGDLPSLANPEPSAVFAPLPILAPTAVATASAGMTDQNANPPEAALANSIRVWLRCP